MDLNLKAFIHWVQNKRRFGSSQRVKPLEKRSVNNRTNFLCSLIVLRSISLLFAKAKLFSINQKPNDTGWEFLKLNRRTSALRKTFFPFSLCVFFPIKVPLCERKNSQTNVWFAAATLNIHVSLPFFMWSIFDFPRYLSFAKCEIFSRIIRNLCRKSNACGKCSSRKSLLIVRIVIETRTAESKEKFSLWLKIISKHSFIFHSLCLAFSDSFGGGERARYLRGDLIAQIFLLPFVDSQDCRDLAQLHTFTRFKSRLSFWRHVKWNQIRVFQ